MLQILRKGAAGWVAKIFLGLLVISFGVWGIADVFRTQVNQTVATIGDTEISVTAFREAYQERMRAIGQQRGRPLSVQEAQASGIGQSVLGNLVVESVLDDRANSLGLSLSDDLLAQQIRENPAFRGPGGQFDRLRFAQILRSNNLTEPQLLASERNRSEREQFLDGLTGEMIVPKTLRDALDRYIGETRAVDYVVITPSLIPEQTLPDEAALRTFYDERKNTFRAPEYRKLTLLVAEPAAIAGQQTIDDAAIQEAYDRQKAQFSAPEKRTVQQIAFPTPEEADAAAAKIAGGASFADIANERNLKPADYDLGTVTKADMFDPLVANAAFSLAEGATSGPVRGNFGSVIVHVAKVEPGQERPLSEVRDQIVAGLQLSKAHAALADLHDQIEDQRAGGSTLAEIATKVGLPLQTVDSIDRGGNDMNGAPVPLPDSDRLLQEVFAAETGAETPEVPTGNDGYAWFDLQQITPARDRTFEEAKSRVETAWLADKKSGLVAEQATALLDKLKAGEAFDQVAAASQLQIRNAPSVSRIGSPPDIGRTAANAIFAVAANGGVGSSLGEEPDSRIVFRVASSQMPATPPASTQNVLGQLRESLVGDIGLQYLKGAQDRIGVTYDNRAIQSVIGTPES